MVKEKNEEFTELTVHYARKVQPKRFESEELGCAIKEHHPKKMSDEEKQEVLGKLATKCYNLTLKRLEFLKHQREEKNLEETKKHEKAGDQLAQGVGD